MANSTHEVKETAEGIFTGLGCLSIAVIAFYAIVTGRIFKLVIIYLAFFGLLKLIDYAIISKLPTKKQQSIKGFFNKNTALTVVLMFSTIFGTFFFGTTIINGLTSVDTLTKKIHERSKYKFSGSKCNDGSTSYSQGQGTCSWHDGVDYEFFKGDYAKSLEECRNEAKGLSWRD